MTKEPSSFPDNSNIRALIFCMAFMTDGVITFLWGELFGSNLIVNWCISLLTSLTAILTLYFSQKKSSSPKIALLAGIPTVTAGALFCINRFMVYGNILRVDVLFLGSTAIYLSVYLSALLLLKNKLAEIGQRKLQTSEQWYRDYFDHHPDIVYRAGKGGFCEGIAPSVEKICGYTPEEIIGKRMVDLYKDESSGNTYRTFIEQHGVVDNFVAQLKKKNGTFFWASVHAAALRGPDGLPCGEIGSIRDISSEKKRHDEERLIDKALQQHQKMESIVTLAGGIAHDFNNILAAIIGYAEMAQQKIGIDNHPDQDIGGIIRAALRAKDLIRHILIFSNQTNYDPSPIEMYLTIKEVLKMIEATLPATITIEQNLKCRNGVVLADAAEIHEVILNLCTNAIESMAGKNGILTITLEKTVYTEQDLAGEINLDPGQYISLSIKDTGVGISTHHESRVFDPFFTTKAVGQGPGLGLSIVYSTVKKLRGLISIESVPESGTTVKISLPEAPATQQNDLDETESCLSGTERILFVDDEPVVIDVIKKILGHMGYSVTVSTSSTLALSLFTNNPTNFDLVITDQTMPGITGEELSKKLLAIRPDIPIIMCTGYSADIDVEKAKDIGIKEYIMKPIEKKHLALAIRKVLDKHIVSPVTY